MRYPACYVLLMISLIATPAVGQERPKGAPMASISIQEVQVAFIGSGSIGGGALAYRGKSYPISVTGLGVGGFGASRLSASGDVYGLRNYADVAGPYVQIRSGWALGDQGKGTLWLRNGNGVTMRLKTVRRGLQLALGADGVIIALKDR